MRWARMRGVGLSDVPKDRYARVIGKGYLSEGRGIGRKGYGLSEERVIGRMR